MEEEPIKRELVRTGYRPRIETPKPPERIKGWVASCITIFALCVDAIQAKLTAIAIGVVLGPIISVGAYTAVGITFLLCGVSLLGDSRKILTLIGTGAVEATFSFIPGFTGWAVMIILQTWAEDGKEGWLGEIASKVGAFKSFVSK